MRKFVLLIFLLLIPLALAQSTLEECGRIQTTSMIPCVIVSTFKPADGCVGNISIYLNSSYVKGIRWRNATPFCETTFDITEPLGSYVYNSSIEDGIITLELEDNMLSIILVQIFMISFFIVIGVPHKVGFVKIATWGLALIELMITVWIVYINQAGKSIIVWLYWNSMIMLILGGSFGFLSIIMFMARMAKPDENAIKEDSYTKYLFGK